MAAPRINLSRQAVQVMLEMKSLLRHHGITVTLTAPDAYEQLVKASARIDDPDIVRVRERLLATEAPGTPQAEEAVALDAPAAAQSDPMTQEQRRADHMTPLQSAEAPSRPGRVEVPPLEKVRTRGEPVVAQPLEQSPPPAESGVAQPPAQVHAPAAPVVAQPLNNLGGTHVSQAGVLTCERCQGSIPVQVTQQDRTAPMSVHCACGMEYQVETDARRHPRKHAHLPGVYMDLEDETRTGPMVVEDISFGGIRFRITAPHTIACDACLHIQFTLDDASHTCIWEQVQVRHVHGDTIGAAFLDMDVFNKSLAAYVK